MDCTPFLHGHVRCERLDGAPVPRRHSAAQEALLSEDPVWPRCARGCAGIELRLRTDSTFVDLRLRTWGDVRPRLALDVEVDGAWHRSVREADAPGVVERRVFEVQDRGQRILRTIRIHLPIGLEVAVEGLTVDPGAVCEPVPAAGRRLLCLGDSITQGHAAGSPAATWASLLARLRGMELRNQGIAGHVWHPDYLAEVPAWEPHEVVVAYGVNDWSRGGPAGADHAAAIGARAADGLARLRPRIGAARLAVLTPLGCAFAHETRHGCDLAAVRAAIAAAARAAGAQVIDGATILPAEPWWTADGLHPNDAGMALIAERVHRALGPVADGGVR
jgi:lysophospholipase L1-like esterase